MKVYKYPIPVENEFKISMPTGARVLCVHPQGDQVCIWALVDPEKEPTPRRFLVVPTGQEIEPEDPAYGPSPDNCGRYVGTFQVIGGSIVFQFHLFERGQS